MGGHYISLACRGPSFFSGYIIDHESCLISESHLRNEHIYPCSTMSRSVEDSQSTRLTCTSTNSVNISRLFKLRQNPMHSSIDDAEFQQHVSVEAHRRQQCELLGDENDICMGVVKNSSKAVVLTDDKKYMCIWLSFWGIISE